ncbi:uncharacterized protein LOC131311372 [Rhododendron vialii]|uniref:uncharacterized protein LOC131311372 n=1 Tax=Rhododendron vialii TaxID=182163 RepID=UPI00266056AD|nr:uncharacterized protein LOC131311372 [Rhododendron vialii]
MISSALLKMRPMKLSPPAPFSLKRAPFRSLSSQPRSFSSRSIPTSPEDDSKSKEDRRIGEMLTGLKSGVLYIKTQLRLNGLIVGRGSGTGFLITKRKAATAAHVISERFPFDIQGVRGSRFVTFTVWAKLPGGKFHSVKVTAVDTVHDIACLSLPDGMVNDLNSISKLDLSHYNLLLGQRLFFVGNTAFQWSVKSALFSAIRTGKEILANDMEETLHDPSRSLPGDLYIEADGVVEAGASGGPVVTEKGLVAAIMIAGGEGLALASPIQYLKDLLVWEQSKKGQLVFLYGEVSDDFEEDNDFEEDDEDQELVEDDEDQELDEYEEVDEEVGEDEEEVHEE